MTLNAISSTVDLKILTQLRTMQSWLKEYRNKTYYQYSYN